LNETTGEEKLNGPWLNLKKEKREGSNQASL